MAIRREAWMILLVIGALFVLVSALALITPHLNPLRSAVRLCGLLGFLALAIATIMTPFLREITTAFGKPFLRIHHIFAILGVVLVTLHPVFLAIQLMNPAVFIPRFDSWQVFWELAGRPALYILYIATLAAVLRRMAPKYWRPFHVLMYVVLFFALVHGNLIGTDFRNLGILLVMDSLFAAAIGAFAFKRYRNYARRTRAKAA